MSKKILSICLVVVLAFTACFLGTKEDARAEGQPVIICVDYTRGGREQEDGTVDLLEMGERNPETVDDISAWNVSCITCQGWFGSLYSANYTFGYRINNGEPVLKEEYHRSAEYQVYDAVRASLGDYLFADRFVIPAPVVHGANVKIEFLAVPAEKDQPVTVLKTFVYTNPSPVKEYVDGYRSKADQKDCTFRVEKPIDVEDSVISFETSVRLVPEKPIEADWNRLILEYESDTDVRGLMEVEIDGKKETEAIFLDAAKEGKASQLISGYAEGRKLTRILSVTLENVRGAGARFCLRSLSGETVGLPKDGVAVLEDDRVKVVIDLLAGGGISYFEDKNDGDDTLGNLLSAASPDRKIQQSYYTADGRYNPSQSGDIFGNKGKILDFVYAADHVYVKCVPLDYVKNNQLTDSVMETRYTLKNGTLEVSNRFLDFSSDNAAGLVETECPALYTVSYLDTFVYYPGSNSWTGRLKEVKDLPGWEESDESYRSTNGNPECWGGWFNGETGRGIGVYTPDTQILRAGRLDYNGSKDPADSSANCVAPLKDVEITAGVPISYTFLLSAGSMEEVRNAFLTGKDNMAGEWIPESSVPFVPREGQDLPLPTREPGNTPEPSEPVTDTVSGGSWPAAIGILALAAAGTVALVLGLTRKNKEKETEA